MKRNKVNRMSNRVAFYSKDSGGPEAHGDTLVQVYECACDDYEPTTKDYTALSSPGEKHALTITIRNVSQEFRPEYNQVFRVMSGYFKGINFEIKTISPYSDNPNFIKIVGES